MFALGTLFTRLCTSMEFRLKASSMRLLFDMLRFVTAALFNLTCLLSCGGDFLGADVGTEDCLPAVLCALMYVLAATLLSLRLSSALLP